METNNLKIIGQIKKLFFIVLATVVFALLMSVSSVRAEVTARFDEDNGCLTVSYSEGSDSSVVTYAVINEAIENSSGTTVDARRANIKSVIINSGITVIGDSAFKNCTNLTSIDIPNGVTTISTSAFKSCSRLMSITIPSSVTSIGYSAFYGCSSLTFISIPESVESIGGIAFGSCDSLSTVFIKKIKVSILSDTGISDTVAILIYNDDPSEVRGVNNTDESKITSVIIPEGVTSIDYFAFRDCSSLKSITIPSSVTSIGYSAFCGCSSLKSITIPEGVTSINDNVFDGCSSLKSITIPSGVKSIYAFAFKDCGNLTSITIPASVTSIGSGAFFHCSSLVSITIPVGVTLIDENTFSSCSSLESITIPESVTSIGTSAFSHCSSLVSITIPVGVTLIAENTFSSCSSLECIAIPEGVTSIGVDAFNGCSSLTYITIPDSVTSIGQYAFRGCSSLTYITIPDSVTSIGQYAFSGCSSLVTVFIKASKVGILSGTGISDKVAILIYNDDPSKVIGVDNKDKIKITSVVIPASIVTIGNQAFRDLTNLKTVLFAEDSQLTTIERIAFQGCSSLECIAIPEGVTSIGVDAFNGCSSLTYITIPDSVTSIGQYAFSGCSSFITVFIKDSKVDILSNTGISDKVAILTYYDEPSNVTGVANADNSKITSVIIPASVVNIDSDVFENFTNLKTVLFAEGSKLTTIGTQVFRGCSSLESIMIPESVTSIGQFAFRDCSSLEEISIPEGVTSINQSTFYGCSSLKVISIPASVTVIRSQAFRNCTSLTTVSFADESSLTQISANAFNGCTSLETITIPASVTSIGQYAFSGCSSLNTVTFTAKSTGTILTITPAMFPQGAYVLNGGSVTSLTGDMDVTSSGNVTIKILVSVTPTKKLGSEDSTPLLEVDTDVEHYELENSILVPRMVSLSLAAPDESDYEFLGWFRAGTDDVLLCELPTYELIIKDDVSCEARYISGQKAIFKAYDVLTYTSIAGATSITMLVAPVPNYGWAFTGWKCEGDDELIAAGAKYDIPKETTGDITFTAQFQPIGSVVEDETVSVTVNGGQAQSIPIGWFTVSAKPPEGKYFDHWVQTIGNRTVTSYLNPGTFWVAEDCSIEAVYSDTPVAQIATAKLMSYHDGEFTFFITAPGTITEVGVVASSADDVSTANLIIGNAAVEYVRCVSKEMKRNSRTLNWRISALNLTWSVRPYVIYKVAGDTEGEVKTITTYGARSTSKNFII